MEKVLEGWDFVLLGAPVTQLVEVYFSRMGDTDGREQRTRIAVKVVPEQAVADTVRSRSTFKCPSSRRNVSHVVMRSSPIASGPLGNSTV